jgi:hypothetical protein
VAPALSRCNAAASLPLKTITGGSPSGSALALSVYALAINGACHWGSARSHQRVAVPNGPAGLIATGIAAIAATGVDEPPGGFHPR